MTRLFGRYNRSNANLLRPEGLPTYQQSLLNYGQTFALGYTHLFNATTILNIHYGYTNTNFGQFDGAGGAGVSHSHQLQPACACEKRHRSRPADWHLERLYQV